MQINVKTKMKKFLPIKRNITPKQFFNATNDLQQFFVSLFLGEEYKIETVTKTQLICNYVMSFGTATKKGSLEDFVKYIDIPTMIRIIEACEFNISYDFILEENCHVLELKDRSEEQSFEREGSNLIDEYWKCIRWLSLRKYLNFNE